MCTHLLVRARAGPRACVPVCVCVCARERARARVSLEPRLRDRGMGVGAQEGINLRRPPRASLRVIITNQLERAEGDGGRVTAPVRRLRVGGSGFQPVSATLRDLCIHILGEGYYHYCIVCLCLRGTRAGERRALSSRASRI